MEYDCKLAPFDKLSISERGVADPLCNDCQSPDCTNPIREVTVSKIGIQVKMRLYVINTLVRQVIACKGYIGKQDVHVSDV